MKMFIPGRIEFLGKHTDYCGGRSIVCAIDRGFHADVEPRNDTMLTAESRDTGEVISFDLATEPHFSNGHWANYVAETARRMTRNFPDAMSSGATIRFHSDLPKAAGLSSSSSLIIMSFVALASVNGISETPIFRANLPGVVEIAEYLGCVENGRGFRELEGTAGVGTFGGSQDHAAILLGRTDRLSAVSFAPLTVDAEFAFPADHSFVVASSGVTAEKTGAARDRYNRVSQMVTEITASHGGTTLRGLIDEIGMDALRPLISRGQYSFSAGEMLDRVEHFYIENYEIIPAVGKLLSAGQFENIGPLIDHSQQNAAAMLGNQVAETVFLQAAARDIGAVAASAFGAGFGGSVYALVPSGDAERFCGEWQRIYHTRFPQHIELSSLFVTRPSQIELPPSFLTG